MQLLQCKTPIFLSFWVMLTQLLQNNNKPSKPHAGIQASK